jgi:hypothetical protein
MKTTILDFGQSGADRAHSFAVAKTAGRFAPTIGLCLMPIAAWSAAFVTPAAAQSMAPVSAQAPVSPAAPAPTDPDTNEWKYASRLTAVLTYDDNIFIQQHDKQNDFILHLAPSVAIGTGNFRSEFAPFAAIPHFLARTGEEEIPHKNFAFASYTPDAALFSDHHRQDALNHDVRFEGRREQELWATQGEFRFQSVADTDIDVGRRLRQTYYTADGSASYQLSGRTTGSVTIQGNHSDYVGGLSSTDVSAGGFLDYQVAPKTQVGFGASGGYLSVASGANQTYGQPLLRLKYEPTAKLTFSGEAGEEFRHFDSRVGDRSQFIFELNSSYAPADGTNLTVTGRRETHGSAEYSGENIVATTYQGSLRQRFLRRNYLSMAGGFVRNDYENNQSLTAVSRRDNYYFGRVSSSRDLTDRGTIELSYEYRNNDSSAANFGFNENVVSLAASFLF